MNTIITAKEMQLGDDVALENPSTSYKTSKVIQITEEKVVLFRPYATCSDFSYSSNRVIPYIGIEQYEISITSTVKYILLSRNPVT